jgi:Ca2+:H+ antiporter
LTVAVVVELLHASALLVFALTSLALDGKSNWLEGAMLCGVYAFAALVFFFSS